MISIIPSIEQLRQRSAVRALEARFGADATVDALRARRRASATRSPAAIASLLTERAVVARIESAAAAQLGDAFRPSLEPVVNASGVIVHTNLGRAPLAGAALERVAAVARGYSTLEYDLERGVRGRRDVHAEALLCRLTGAEAAVVVNNNAAATMIVLAALAAGREVIVSRGELVEIGGGFRVPGRDGAVRRAPPRGRHDEQDARRRLRRRDHRPHRADPARPPVQFPDRGVHRAAGARAISSQLAKNSTSPSPRISEAATCAVKPVSDRYPTGVGRMSDTPPTVSETVGALREPAVADTIAAGVDVCCFSGDKLLGGPQAGIIVGRAAIWSNASGSIR